jgi:hypothetical protein
MSGHHLTSAWSKLVRMASISQPQVSAQGKTSLLTVTPTNQGASGQQAKLAVKKFLCISKG